MILDLPEKPLKWLVENIGKDNLAEQFEDSTLQAIGSDVVSMYGIDKASRSEWEKKIEAGIKTAKQVVEGKTFPWPGAANTKDALMAEAAGQFAARAGGEVIRGQDVVKVKVTGDDPEDRKSKRAKRVSMFMSYECTDGMQEWEADNDQLLTSVSLLGMYYKKTYRDPILGRNVSYARSPLNIIVHEDTKTLETARRITDDGLFFSKNEVIERIRKGIWCENVLEKLSESDDAPEQFLEQHRTLDLDGDGYGEPYVVTVHKDTQTVCRIVARYEESGITKGKGKEKEKVARIDPIHYFTEFPFLLSPDGKFHKIGWAHLLGPNTEIINTIVNQLLDAGTLANCPPVFIGKGAKLPQGGLRLSPGKMIPVESLGQAMRDNVFIPSLVGPSDVLFRLLGLLSERGQKLANLSDSMQGETGGANVPATTTLALLDQALKVYTSILKRLFRSYRQEFQKLYKLNRDWLTDKEYIEVIDLSPKDAQEMGVDLSRLSSDGSSREVVEKDFSINDKDIQPVMDPTASSEALRLAKLNAMAQAAGMPPAVGRIYLEGIGINQKDVDTIFPPKDPNAAPPPDPTMIELQAKIVDMQAKSKQKDRELDQKHAEIEQKEALLIKQLEKLDAEIVQIKALSIKALADAEAAEIGTQIGVYQSELEQLNADRDHELAKQEAKLNAASVAGGEKDENGGTGKSSGTGSDTGGTGPVEGDADNQEGAGVPQGQAIGGPGGMGSGELSAGIPGVGGLMDVSPGGEVSSVRPNVQPAELPAPGPMQ